MKAAIPNSRRSQKRANRGFKSLEQSCRKHRRAARRSAESREIGGKVYDAGQKIDPNTAGKTSTYVHTAGGSIKYH